MHIYRLALRKLSRLVVLGAAVLAVPNMAFAQGLLGLGPCSSTSAPALTVKAFADAYSHQDPDTAIALTTPDFVRYSATTPKPMNRADYYNMFKSFDAAFPDERWEVKSLVACGQQVTLQVIERGTFLYPWVMADGYVAQPTGRSYTNVSVIQFQIDPATNLIKSYLQITALGFLTVGLTPEDMLHIVASGY